VGCVGKFLRWPGFAQTYMDCVMPIKFFCNKLALVFTQSMTWLYQVVSGWTMPGVG